MELQKVNTLTGNITKNITESMAGYKDASAIEVVSNEKQEGQLLDFGKMVRQKIKDVEAERLTYVSGASKWVKDANAVFKPITTQLKQLKDVIDDRLKAYQLVLEAEAEKKREAMQEVVKESPFAEEAIVPEVQVKASKKTEKSTANYRDVTKWRVSDHNKIPHGYLMIDRDAVDEAIKRGETILGIETYTEKILTIR